MAVYVNGQTVGVTKELEKKEIDKTIKFQGGTKPTNTFYVYQIDDSRKLISGLAKDFGLWLYVDGSEYATQIYSEGAFSAFGRVGNLMLITNGDARISSNSLPEHIITLDLETFEITNKRSSVYGRDRSICVYGTKALVYGADSPYVFDFLSGTLAQQSINISNVRDCAFLDDVFIAGGGSSKNYYIDLNTFEINTIQVKMQTISNAGESSHLYKLNDNEYLVYGSYALYLFNKSEKTIVALASSSNYYDKYISVGDKLLFYYRGSAKDFIVFDKNTKTAKTVAVSSSRLINNFIPDGLNFILTTSSNLEYYVYDTDEVQTLQTKVYSPSYVSLENGDVLIIKNNVYYFNHMDKTLTKSSNSINNINRGLVIGTDVFVYSGSSLADVGIYDITTKKLNALTGLSLTNTGVTDYEIDGNTAYITMGKQKYYYDGTEKTFTLLSFVPQDV